MKEVIIRTDYILLGQLLKFEGIISNGGESKTFLASNIVIINGEIDQRRGKKLYPGDQIEVLGIKYLIVNDKSVH